ncbi:MAG: hypothetical protein R3174_10670 [Gammaproteobacteria bacterium]|nr:hypothetical protein [Gammaproteobacteria bacterium]
MSMFFDSPIEFCPVAKKYVLLDQTQASCAREEGCPAGNCPLARWFNRDPARKPAGRAAANRRGKSR